MYFSSPFCLIIKKGTKLNLNAFAFDLTTFRLSGVFGHSEKEILKMHINSGVERR